MTVKDELEILAKDCEECADEADKWDKGEARAWRSVAYRIRHAAKQISGGEVNGDC